MTTRRRTLRGLANLTGVLLVYFSIPLDGSGGQARVLVGVLLSAAGLVLAGVVLQREVVRVVTGADRGLDGFRLLLLLEIVLVLFSFAYYGLATAGDHEMAGLATRLDALYFSATTMTTVGYGDVHAVGQVARAVTTAQLVFDVVFLAVFARLVSTAIGQGPGAGPR